MLPLSVTRARAIDRDAVERLGMPSILLMENASAGVARAARPMGERFVVLCGPGNNGGDGLAAARHLGLRAGVHLLAEPDPERSPDAALQLRILRAAGVEVTVGAGTDRLDPGGGDGQVVWIDALFGTGLMRPLRGLALDWVAHMNAASGRRLSVDIPSGLHGDTGEPLGGHAVRACRTVTFAAPKLGLVQPAAQGFVGQVEVVPLGLP